MSDASLYGLIATLGPLVISLVVNVLQHLHLRGTINISCFPLAGQNQQNQQNLQNLQNQPTTNIQVTVESN